MIDLSDLQHGVFGARRIRRVNIRLLDANGNILHRTTMAPKHAGRGGAFTLPALMDAVNATDEIRAPFIIPGLESNDCYQWSMILDDTSRVDRSGFLIA